MGRLSTGFNLLFDFRQTLLHIFLILNHLLNFVFHFLNRIFQSFNFFIVLGSHSKFFALHRLNFQLINFWNFTSHLINFKIHLVYLFSQNFDILLHWNLLFFQGNRFLNFVPIFRISRLIFTHRLYSLSYFLLYVLRFHFRLFC